MKHYLIAFLILAFPLTGLNAGIIPEERTVDWTSAGYHGETPEFDRFINILDFGGDNTGVSPNDNAFTAALALLNGEPTVIYFPAGEYLFEKILTLRSNLIIRGAGADSTKFVFDMTVNNRDCIRASGTNTKIQTSLVSTANKGVQEIEVEDASEFSVGDYMQLKMNDADWVVSDWAVGTVGQIVQIVAIKGNLLRLNRPLRLDYTLDRSPFILKLNMLENIGIECISIVNKVQAGSVQIKNINFINVAQSWIKGISSFDANFSHICLERCTNITVRDSYFQDAQAYGGDGQGYGVVCQITTNECKIENNIFKHLRHSMLLQAGANANVFGYNYSREAFWTGTIISPKDAAGDIVLHGNYVYANLFEGNIVQNIVIDDSHGKNGPFNTLFRNRAELYGIFMNNNPATDEQNFVGNEITNSGVLKGLYTITGKNHFQYADNIRGSIKPSGTNELNDITYYLDENSTFYQTNDLPEIGLPNKINTGTNPAQTRYESGVYTLCQKEDESVPTQIMNKNDLNSIQIYPNPTSESVFFSKNKNLIYPLQISIFDSKGQQVLEQNVNSVGQGLSLKNLPKSTYLIYVQDNQLKSYVSKVVLK
ncbi:MAG: T9SS type A sorting domain-containing protein [Chitinophagales bacterium]|nr:T9SS type A sorting domain-containing protein [Chitinophagales bacterium]